MSRDSISPLDDFPSPVAGFPDLHVKGCDERGMRLRSNGALTRPE